MNHRHNHSGLMPLIATGYCNPKGCSGPPNIEFKWRIALTNSLLVLVLSPALAFGYPFSLTWNEMNEDSDGVIVYRYAAGEYQEVAILGPRVAEFTDDPPGAPGDSFCWTVRSFREGLISEPSNEACATVPATTRETPAKRRAHPE